MDPNTKAWLAILLSLVVFTLTGYVLWKTYKEIKDKNKKQ